MSLHTFLFHTHTKTVPRGKATFHLINPQTKKIPPLYLSVSELGCRIPRQKPDPGTVSEKPLKFDWVAGSFMSKAPLHSFPRSAFHCSERETDSPQTHSHTHTHTQTQQPTTSWGSGFTNWRKGNLITKQSLSPAELQKEMGVDSINWSQNRAGLERMSRC